MKHILLKCALMGAVVILGSIGAQAAWTYDAEAGTLSDGGYTFKVSIVSLADPASENGDKIEGFRIDGLTTAGTSETIDFTSAKTEAGHDVISFNESWNNETTKILNNTPCKTLIAPALMYLGRMTFRDNGTLESLTISDKITEFPYYCFDSAVALKTLKPMRYPYIKEQTAMYAMYNVKSLTGTFEFPELTKLSGESCFSGCSALFEMPKVKYLGKQALRNCSNLTGDLNFNELETIEYAAFANTGIKSLTAPNATNVGMYAFMDCASLTGLVFNAEAAANYANEAFQSCKNLKTLSPMPVFSNLANTYDDNGNVQSLSNPILGCSSLVGSLEITGTEELKSLTANWMQNCKAITNVTIKVSALETVANNVFQNICPGATIYWDSEKAPTSFGASAFSPEGGKHFARIYVKNDLDGWAKLLSKKAADFTTADKEKTGYPGKKTLGLINGNVYVVKDGVSGMMILIR